MTNATLLKAEKIAKQFTHANQTLVAYRDLNFDLHQGEFCALVGPSGCGKTTLLRTLAGLETVSEGRMIVLDPQLRKRIAMMFQKGDLFPWLTVRKNLELLLNIQDRPESEVDHIVQTWLGKLKLEEFADYYPHQISGGMCQRVAIARAFSIDPELLLLDEPFVFLDDLMRSQLHVELEQLWLDRKPTIVFVTHDIEEAVLLADRVWVMSSSPGTIIKEVFVNLPRPRNRAQLRQEKSFVDMVTAITGIIGVRS